jgi:hypothetical protein
MPKIKPNEKCPCGSNIKYKKCCSSTDFTKKLDQQDIEKKKDNIIAAETVSSTKVKSLMNYFLVKYKLESVDISNNANQRIIQKHTSKPVFVIVEKNETNTGLFKKYGDDMSNVIVFYKRNYQGFNYETEYDQAIKAINNFNF